MSDKFMLIQGVSNESEISNKIFFNTLDFSSPSLSDFSIVRLRHDLCLTQSEFAKVYNISLSSLKKWEQGETNPVFNGALKKMLDDWLTIQLNGFCIITNNREIGTNLAPDKPIKDAITSRVVTIQERIEVVVPNKLLEHLPRISGTDQKIFRGIVEEIIAYKPSEHIKSWEGRDVSRYPRTLEGWISFREDLENGNS